jgi:hypothetical protein
MAQVQEKTGGTFRALLWALGFAAFAAILAYVVGLGISAILSYASGGNFIVSKVLDDFGYADAANAIRGIALNQLYQANSLPFVLSIVAAGVGGVIGYFKGKSED